MRRPSALLGGLLIAGACAPPSSVLETGAASTTDPFADEVISFTPGDGAGFGQDLLPGVVLGPPVGAGDRAGSTDVLSFGEGGEIVLAFHDCVAVDGEGPDLLVFENAFTGWTETGVVAASEDGTAFTEWVCDPTGDDARGCAGLEPVWSAPDNGIDPTDPVLAGGDPFDLADVGLARASHLRIRDAGSNAYSAPTGGFDLDAVAVVNGECDATGD